MKTIEDFLNEGGDKYIINDNYYIVFEPCETDELFGLYRVELHSTTEFIDTLIICNRFIKLDLFTFENINKMCFYELED